MACLSASSLAAAPAGAIDSCRPIAHAAINQRNPVFMSIFPHAAELKIPRALMSILRAKRDAFDEYPVAPVDAEDKDVRTCERWRMTPCGTSCLPPTGRKLARGSR